MKNVGDFDAGTDDLGAEKIGWACDSFSIEDFCFSFECLGVGGLVMDIIGLGDGDFSIGIMDFGEGDLDNGNLNSEDGPGWGSVGDFDTGIKEFSVE